MHTIRTTAALAVASGVAVASFAAPAAAHPGAASATATTKSPAAAAAGFLSRQLIGKHHDHYTSSYESGGKTYTYVNYGETADAILSMDAAGVGQTAAARATAYLEAHVNAYAGSSIDNYGPGQIGKLMLVAEAQHVPLHKFGGANLYDHLVATEGIRGASPGEYQQNPTGTDPSYTYFSTTSQALAVEALADTSVSGHAQPDQAAVSFLAAQQCSDGGFPSQILENPTDACNAGEDLDSTSYAVQALIATGSHLAAFLGLSYIARAENPNGSFGTSPNANSAALAIQALIAGHKGVTKAERWLAGQQVGCSAPAARRGAVKYQRKYNDSALLATSQAGAALAGKPLAWIDKQGAHGAAPALACPKPKKN